MHNLIGETVLIITIIIQILIIIGIFIAIAMLHRKEK